MGKGGGDAGPSAVPAWLTGAWHRGARSVAGGRCAEPSAVVWLQVGEHFADVRVAGPGAGDEPHPLDATQAFSGRLRCALPHLTWCHDVDTVAAPADRPDTAVVGCQGATLVEVGDGYVEAWVRQPTVAPAAVLELREVAPGPVGGRVVRVGDRAAAVWRDPEPAGVALVLERAGWSVTGAVGVSARLAALPDHVRAAVGVLLQPGAVPPAGWRAPTPDGVTNGCRPPSGRPARR